MDLFHNMNSKSKYRGNYIPRTLLSLISLIFLISSSAHFWLMAINLGHLVISSIWIILVEFEFEIVKVEKLRYIRITLDSSILSLFVFSTGFIYSYFAIALPLLITLSSLYKTSRYGIFSVLMFFTLHVIALMLYFFKIIPLYNFISNEQINISYKLAILSSIALLIVGFITHKVIHSIFIKLYNTNKELSESEAIHRRDLMMAANVQSAFFINEPPKLKCFDIAFTFKPLAEVSGDFYDFFSHDNILDGIGIFDVSGHGISSGLVTLMARSIIFRNFKKLDQYSLEEISAKINKELIQEIGKIDNYITGIMVSFIKDKIEFINAAHPDMLIKNGKTKEVREAMGSVDNKKNGNSFLGIEMLNAPFHAFQIETKPDDILLLYTDCLIETKNPQGENFGIGHLKKVLGEAPEGSADDMLNHILKEFYDFTSAKDSLNDDLTVILIKIKSTKK